MVAFPLQFNRDICGGTATLLAAGEIEAGYEALLLPLSPGASPSAAGVPGLLRQVSVMEARPGGRWAVELFQGHPGQAVLEVPPARLQPLPRRRTAEWWCVIVAARIRS